VRTPLVRYDGDAGEPEIFLKLENLQPIGSFKLRGALSRMLVMGRDELSDGVYTASAGNMAQGVAWAARSLGVPASVIVPESAPRAKVDAITRLGATAFRCRMTNGGQRCVTTAGWAPPECSSIRSPTAR
jgi:threonine dehydratase